MKESKRNKLLLFICFLVYAVSYIGKRTYSVNLVNVESSFGISKEFAGYVSSAFFFAYGAGQFINGFLCEKMNSKWTVSVALMLSALITVIMYFITNVVAMAILWGMNGLALSVLWTHSVKLLSTIKDERYKARSTTVMSATLPVGVVVAFGLGTLFTYLADKYDPYMWKLNYVVSGGCVAAVSLIFFFILDCIEKSAEKEALKNAQPVVDLSHGKEQGGNFFRVLGMTVVPIFFLCVGTGLVRDGTDSWFPSLLKDVYALPEFFSILLTVGLPLMGVFSAFLSTSLMKWTKSAMLACFISAAAATVLSVILIFTFHLNMPVLVVMFMALVLFVYVLSNTTSTVLPLYYKGQIKSGQAAGILNTFIYVGSAVSTVLLGSLVDNFGWQSFIVCLTVCGGVMTLASVWGIFLMRKKKGISL